MTTVFDSINAVTTIRIAGAREDVVAEVQRISVGAGPACWVRFLGPVLWGGEYVVHGEIHDMRKA